MISSIHFVASVFFGVSLTSSIKHKKHIFCTRVLIILGDIEVTIKCYNFIMFTIML